MTESLAEEREARMCNRQIKIRERDDRQNTERGEERRGKGREWKGRRRKRERYTQRNEREF